MVCAAAQKNARYANGQKGKHWRDIGSGAASPLVVPSNVSNNIVYTDADPVKLREAQPTLYPPGRGNSRAGRRGQQGIHRRREDVS